MAYGNGPNTKPKQSKGNTMGGDSLNFNVDGGGNALGGGKLKVKTFPGTSGSEKTKGFDSTPIPTNEQ